MLKTLGKQIKEFKLVSILTPIAMLAEVIVENFIPLLMATIIDSIGCPCNCRFNFRIPWWCIWS